MQDFSKRASKCKVIFFADADADAGLLFLFGFRGSLMERGWG